MRLAKAIPALLFGVAVAVLTHSCGKKSGGNNGAESGAPGSGADTGTGTAGGGAMDQSYATQAQDQALDLLAQCTGVPKEDIAFYADFDPATADRWCGWAAKAQASDLPYSAYGTQN
jgi:hypothetical protein